MVSQKEALPGPEERRQILEQAQQVAIQARNLLERLPADLPSPGSTANAPFTTTQAGGTPTI